MGGGQPQGGIKFTLDLAIGETSAIESTDKGKLDDIVQKVKDLNGRLQDIRREQVFQRVSQIAAVPFEGLRVVRSTNSIYRSVRPSSAINPKQQTPEWCAGR